MSNNLHAHTEILYLCTTFCCTKAAKSVYMHSTLTQDHDDLYIAQYLDMQGMPRCIQELLPVATTQAQKDMLLLALLTATSSLLPNLSFTHGSAGKRYYANLLSFIEAGPASGKGIAQLALQLVKAVEADRPLIIPGNSTHPAFLQWLSQRDGRAYCQETEGSVITDVWKGTAGNYSTTLRKAAEHEMISQARKSDEPIIIPNPQLSMLLTGTYDQFRKLVPNTLNGLFSRFCMLVIRDRQTFDPQVFLHSSHGRQTITLFSQWGERLRVLHKVLNQQAEDIHFALTTQQAQSMGTHFAETYASLTDQLGPNMHSTIVRMGVHVMRIAMILSAMRLAEQSEAELSQWVNQLGDHRTFFCADTDLSAARLIADKLLLHAADVFAQIEGDKQADVPAAMANVQKETFFHLLPKEFTSKLCEEQSNTIGVHPRTARRWLETWVDNGRIIKIAFGKYQKSA